MSRSRTGLISRLPVETAERFVADGSYFWNSGIFLLPARTSLDELARLAPEVLAACRAAIAGSKRYPYFLRLPEKQFSASPSISNDYAVFEKTERAALVKAPFDWNDIGSFSALCDVGEKDENGNVEIGDVISENATGCYLRGDGPLVAALGRRQYRGDGDAGCRPGDDARQCAGRRQDR